MPYNVESWAFSKVDSTKAVKVLIRLEGKPTTKDFADLRTTTTGLFRRTYAQWADGLGEKATLAQ